MPVHILGIESSCDDTSAAIIYDNVVLSNVIASQKIHQSFGGVVPELASRAHQQNIIPIIDVAIKNAKIQKSDIKAISFTLGPGLLGSLLVGVSFAKGLSIGLDIPLIQVNHLQAHVLAHFLKLPDEDKKTPSFPFLCLTVSGGHTQIVRVDSPYKMSILGQTIDDAAGEAFDKAAKILGLEYPGGPLIDKHAKLGNPKAFSLSKPNIPELNFSFSGLKTSFLYLIRDNLKINPNFIEENLNDLCASFQHSVISILMNKLEKAVKQTGITEVAIAGGVSANSGLRDAISSKQGVWQTYIPNIQFTTDNAAMIAIAGYFKYINNDFTNVDAVPFSRSSL